MRLLLAPTSALLLTCALAQDPVITSWIINPGSETGYGGYATNVQSVYYNAANVYVSSTCIPGYDIGPWTANPNLPANQNFCFRITRTPVPNTGTLVNTALGHIGVWRNGVSIFNAKDGMSYNNQGVWNRDALYWEGISFDACLGHPAPNGEYHHHVSPNCLYDHLDDSQHSDLIGYAFDGYPIYGAYGYANADGSGGIARMRSSYQLRSITERTTLPNGTVLNSNQYGPAIGGQYPLGAYIEDYAFVAGSGDLDVHNGRFCITPEYPAGTYAYFVTINDQDAPAYPYVIGPQYYGTVPAGNTGPGGGHNTIPGDAVLYTNTGTAITDVPRATFSVAPNPATDHVVINSSTAMVRARITDPSGRTESEVVMNGVLNTLPVADLAAGVHIVELQDVSGAVHVLRFVKE